MKHFFILILVISSGRLFSQSIHGVVLNKVNNQPIESAILRTDKSTTLSSRDGNFELNNVHEGDTVRISCLSYKPSKLIIKTTGNDQLVIYLEPLSIMLRDVQINRERNFTQDSIRNRQQYAAEFNYKAPGVMDMFVNKSAYEPVFSNKIPEPSTASLVSVDLLSILGRLTKPDNQKKMQSVLLKEEEGNYVVKRFNEKKITQLTGLKADSLKIFMDRYTPSAAGLKSMSDYDVLLYIKKCYAELVK